MTALERRTIPIENVSWIRSGLVVVCKRAFGTTLTQGSLYTIDQIYDGNLMISLSEMKSYPGHKFSIDRFVLPKDHYDPIELLMKRIGY